MNHVECLHCGSHALSTILRFQSRATFRCEDCGGYLNDPGIDTDLLYNKNYYERNYLPHETAQLRETRWQIETIRKIVQQGSVLDYGCGTGILLRTAKKHGFTRNVGADVSADGLRIAARKLGDSAQLVHIPQESLPDRRFEVITLMDSLSAISNPRETVLTLKERHLSEGGILVIRTPDLRSSYFRLVVLLSKMIGAKYGSRLMFAKVRYLLFDPETLRRFVESVGLRVVSIRSRREFRHPVHLDSIKNLIQTLLLRIFFSGARSIFLIARADGDSIGESPPPPVASDQGSS